MVYEQSTTETQSARRKHREKKRKLKVGLTRRLFFGLEQVYVRPPPQVREAHKRCLGKISSIKLLLILLVSVRTL